MMSSDSRVSCRVWECRRSAVPTSKVSTPSSNASRPASNVATGVRISCPRAARSLRRVRSTDPSREAIWLNPNARVSKSSPSAGEATLTSYRTPATSLAAPAMMATDRPMRRAIYTFTAMATSSAANNAKDSEMDVALWYALSICTLSADEAPTLALAR